jgi:hypothetical protein
VGARRSLLVVTSLLIATLGTTVTDPARAQGPATGMSRMRPATSLALQAQAEPFAAPQVGAVVSQVTALTLEYARRSAAAAAAGTALAAGFAALSSAEARSGDADQILARAQTARDQQAQELYVDGAGTGGALGLLTADSPDDALWRMSVGVQIGEQLIAQDARDEQAADALAQRATAPVQAAAAAQARLSQAFAVLRDEELAAQSVLDQARAELARLTAKARAEQAARQAAARLDRAEAAAAATRLTAAGPVTALAIPDTYLLAYRQAAAGCPGMDWTLLAAIGQVESGHGRNDGPSSAGAIGPMQFMPATFAAYAVDGDGDGVADPWDPRDAIFTAAHYLCVAGAGRGPAGVHQAVFGYNHAEWYVDLVLATQAAIAAQQAG